MENIEKKKKKKNRNIVVCRRCWQNKIKMYLVVIFSVNRVTLLRFRFVEKGPLMIADGRLFLESNSVQ